MKKISIIIPVYNVEQWVGRCLKSCLNQDIPKSDYEIIVVNDGTPDNSIGEVLKVMNGYESKEGCKSNIRIINRENGGLSAARNTGLKEAKGEYVWFVDSDDWIEPNVIGNLLEYAENNQLDVLCFNLQLAHENGRAEKFNISFEENGKIYSGSDFICKVGMPPAAWAAIYRRSFLEKNNLKFMEGILHEDQEFTPRAYYLAKRISYKNIVVYNYFQREGSIMKSNLSTKRCKDLLTVADSLYIFMVENVSHGTDAYVTFQNKINFAFSQSLSFYSKEMFPLSVYKKKTYYPLRNEKGLNMKYKIANISLNIYLLLNRLKKSINLK